MSCLLTQSTHTYTWNPHFGGWNGCTTTNTTAAAAEGLPRGQASTGGEHGALQQGAELVWGGGGTSHQGLQGGDTPTHLQGQRVNQGRVLWKMLIGKYYIKNPFVLERIIQVQKYSHLQFKWSNLIFSIVILQNAKTDLILGYIIGNYIKRLK